MTELIDAHIHTERCGHATGTVDEYVAAAEAQCLSAIIITDHLPLPLELDPDRHLAMPDDQLDAYLAEVEDAREEHPTVGVVTGLEADYLPDRIDQTRATLRELRRRADGPRVVLGSVHFLDGWAFDDPAVLAEWDSRDVDQVWRDYFARWCDAARSGLFDVMAHPDLVKKFGHRPSFDARELYQEAAKAASDGNVLIEVSTAGLRKPVGELYPGPDLLREFCAAGVEATVGSDAHSPSEVGFGLEIAYTALREAGYRYILLPVARREQRMIPL